jgi:uncharacterized protein YjbI with pentapeptide repeats
VSTALLIVAGVLSCSLLAAGAVLWMRGERETRGYDLGLAALSGGTIALVVLIAQVGIDMSVRNSERTRSARAEKDGLRLSLSSTRSLEGIDLSEREDLEGINLGRKSLRYSHLAGADLEDASFVLADLRETDLRRASLQRAQLRRARLQRAFIDGARLDAADLSNADLGGARLSWASLAGANLQGAAVRQADLVRANLGGSDLREADLTGVDARAASLVRADARGARLDFADLGRSDLRRARIGPLEPVPGRWTAYDAVLGPPDALAIAVSFHDADLRGASLRGLAVLGDFRGADLRGADLSGAMVSCHLAGPVPTKATTCDETAPEAVDYRRLLDATSLSRESSHVDVLTWILMTAGYSVPGPFQERAFDALANRLPLQGLDRAAEIIFMSPDQARKRLESVAMARQVLAPLAGLEVERRGRAWWLSSSFRGACTDDATTPPAGTDLEAAGAGPDHC